jgi:hypothetical protein
MLEKEEKDRLSWPDVFNHPVIIDTQIPSNVLLSQQKHLTWR